MVYGVACRVRGVGCGVWGDEYRVYPPHAQNVSPSVNASALRVGPCRVWGLGFRVKISGFIV